jgi:hypothetical protein
VATTTSTSSWWQDAFRMDLAEIMDDLDPGWRAWRAGDERSDAA